MFNTQKGASFINNVCFGFNTSDKMASRPSHPGLQLTNFPQDANKMENRFYLKEKKKRASQRLPTLTPPLPAPSCRPRPQPGHLRMHRCTEGTPTPPGDSSLPSAPSSGSCPNSPGRSPVHNLFSPAPLPPSTSAGVNARARQTFSVKVHAVLSTHLAAVGQKQPDSTEMLRYGCVPIKLYGH